MYTAHDRYVLKRSRISIAFRIFFFIFMSVLLFKVLSLFIWILTLPIGGLILFLFQKNDVEVLEYLDEKNWSIQYKQRKIKTRTMRKILSHYFYVVIYFEDKEDQSLVIWKDQVDDQHWRRLLTRAKLN